MYRKTDDPIELLCDLLSDGVERLAARTLGGRQAPAVEALTRADLIVCHGVLDSVICDACEESHMAEVEFDAVSESYGWRCPDAGFVVADPDSVAALSISLVRVVAALAKAFTAAFGTGRWTARHCAGA